VNKSAGVQQKDLIVIVSVLQQYPEVDEAWLFGSRAKGNYRTGSDIDIAIKGEHLTAEITSNISYQLNEETSLPYKFDVLNYHVISNIDLRHHIDRIGIRFFPVSN